MRLVHIVRKDSQDKGDALRKALAKISRRGARRVPCVLVSQGHKLCLRDEGGA